jgi:hypothetical protein
MKAVANDRIAALTTLIGKGAFHHFLLKGIRP